MTGDAATSTGHNAKNYVIIVSQKEAKVNIEEIIEDLKNQLQVLEDLKVQITESQENIRETICQCQMMKEAMQ